MKTETKSNLIHGLTRKEEEEKLAEILELAQHNLERTESYIEELSAELHEMLETYGAKDKETLALWHNTQSQLFEYQRDLQRAQKARKKPYFGRIDFKDPNMPQDESYYVGRVGIAKENAKPVVIDWRAPVASVYYENSIGRCKYVVKSEGVCEIDLRGKRTYEIAEDKLIDFFDTDVVANDDLLTKYLGKSKKAVLGEIIATIQKEQNAIIRKSPKTNLIVQGVAGSGKTTVAMHRISYILYNYEQFRPEDFYIIGSNRILLDYITSVLPDLDVYGILQMTMEQLFVRLLYEDWDEKKYQITSLDRKDADSYIKGSYAWFCDLEKYCEEYERMIIPHKEVRIEKTDALLMDEERIEWYLNNNKQLSMQEKINLLNEFLRSMLENELSGKYVSYTAPEKKELQRKYRFHFGKDVWKGSIYELYQDFVAKQQTMGKNASVKENQFDVYDLAALAYLYRRIKETDGVREASHVIIDEAQDFGMMAYAVLYFCLRDCTYTVMGDVSQNIYFDYGLNDWEELRNLLLTGDFDSFELLKKSYRNTVEISNFATEILRHGDFSVYPVEPIIRHGNEVQTLVCDDEKAMISQTAKVIRGWQSEGHETIAVICRDEKEASHVKNLLGGEITLADSELSSAEFGSGVMVLPVEYTKGLEFDAVLLYHPSKEHYPAQDRYVKLLYVAATRALHELTVVHLGDLTDLIAQPVSEEKRMRSLDSGSRPKAKRFMPKEHTLRELEEQAAIDGHREMAQRDYLGPKRIVVSKKQEAAEQKVYAELKNRVPAQSAVQKQSVAKKNPAKPMPVEKTTTRGQNPSPHQFCDIPDGGSLKPSGHGRIDTSIRWIKKTKRFLELASAYGIMRLTPVGESVVRVQFHKGQAAEFAAGSWEYLPSAQAAWTAREGRSQIEITVGLIIIRIDKKTGALQFFNRDNRLLLAEKSALPRQLETEQGRLRSWNYFDWEKSEKLMAKGILDDQLERMNQKARYISFGKKALRMPLIVSDRGYGLGIAADSTVMCCDIPLYGPYLYTEDMEQIDYYFIYGGGYIKTLEQYKWIIR